MLKKRLFQPVTLLLLGKSPLVCMTDAKNPEKTEYDQPARLAWHFPSLLPSHAPSLSHTPSFGLPLPPPPSLSQSKKSTRGCRRWRDGACIKGPFHLNACQWQTVSTKCLTKRPGLPFPPRHSSQKLLASGERQRRDRASGKRQCTQLLRRGRGNLGWRVRGRKRGGGGWG